MHSDPCLLKVGFRILSSPEAMRQNVLNSTFTTATLTCHIGMRNTKFKLLTFLQYVRIK